MQSTTTVNEVNFITSSQPDPVHVTCTNAVAVEQDLNVMLLTEEKVLESNIAQNFGEYVNIAYYSYYSYYSYSYISYSYSYYS